MNQRGLSLLLPLLLGFAPVPASALTEAEILERFEAYERRIEALESELKTLRAERDAAPPPADGKPVETATPPASRKQVARVEQHVEMLAEELRERRERITFDGFASVGVAQSNSSADFQVRGDQIHDDFDFNADTVLGLQAAFLVNEKASFVTQVVARGVDETRGDDEFDLQVEWAYLNYKLDALTDLRLGRSRLPLFMLSEYLEVGYAYPWVRPPVEVYGLIGNFSNYDGVNLRHSRLLRGDWYLTAQAYWGGRATDGVLAGSTLNIDIDDLFGFNVGLIHGNTRVYASVASADLSLAPLPASLAPVEAALNAAGQTLTVRKEDVDFFGTGFHYNNGKWLGMGEFTRVRINEWLLDWESFYLTGGYQWGDLLTHVTYGKLNSTDHADRVFLGGAVDFRDAPFLIDAEQTSWTVGLRYDLGSGMALKGEWQRVSQFNGTAGMFSSIPDDSVHVWSVVLDAMF